MPSRGATGSSRYHPYHLHLTAWVCSHLRRLRLQVAGRVGVLSVGRQPRRDDPGGPSRPKVTEVKEVCRFVKVKNTQKERDMVSSGCNGLLTLLKQAQKKSVLKMLFLGSRRLQEQLNERTNTNSKTVAARLHPLCLLRPLPSLPPPVVASGVAPGACL